MTEGGQKRDLAIGCEKSTIRACRPWMSAWTCIAGRHSKFSIPAAGGADAHAEDHDVDGTDRDRGSAGK
jgi:hypothetical protein